MLNVGIIAPIIDSKEKLTDIVNEIPHLSYELSSVSSSNFLKFFNDSLDLVIIDIDEDTIVSLRAIRKMKAKSSKDLEVLIVSSSLNIDTILQVFKAGATGYLMKDEKMVNISKALNSYQKEKPSISDSVIKQLVNYLNKSPLSNDKLTSKEKEVINYMMDGLSYKMIADKMTVSINAVRFHVTNIYKKLNIHSRSELFKIYFDGKLAI